MFVDKRLFSILRISLVRIADDIEKPEGLILRKNKNA